MGNDEKLVKGIIDSYSDYYKDFIKINEEVSKSKAVYKGKPVPFLYIPKFFTKEDVIDFNIIVKNIFNLVNKTIELYFKNKEVREIYDFDKRLEELILLEKSYASNVPMGRFDIFYYGKGKYKFCELNTDGSSAMNEDMVLSEIIGNSLLLKELRKDYNIHSFELFDTWVTEVNNIRKEAGISKENPTLCILDFIHDEPSIEFVEFKEAFEKENYEVLIADPRDLTERDGFLFYEEKKIDIIYRRLVTKDLMENYDLIPDLINGIKANKTCIIGNLRSQIVHTKLFFKVLHDERFQKYLTAKEIKYINNHIPITEKIKEVKDKYIANKNTLIAKPIDNYASKGVFAGKDLTNEEWKKQLDRIKDKNYLIQEFCQPSYSKNILFESKEEYIVENFRNITGLFVYNESLYGIYSRLGLNSIISGLHEGYTVPSFYIEKSS
jgi:glutathionylspermidine synthase